MNYLSVCSGIEAATVAWHEMGWNPIAFSEIEKFPSQVLAHHYPNVPNLGDMTKYKEWELSEPIDILVGGTPCQSFSVAGLRKGLDDPRGNLALTYVGILDKFRPKWCIWENVPGVLSSGGGEILAVSSVRWGKSGMGGPTGCLMLNTLEYPKDADECLLSDVLEIGSLPQKYYLTPTACQGILRRAEKRGKELPILLLTALQHCVQEITKESEITKLRGGGKLIMTEKVSPTLQTSCNDYSRADGFTMMVYETHPADSRVKEMGDTCQTVTSRWGTGGGNVPIVQKAYSIREDATANNFSATPLEVTPALQALRPSVQSHHAQTFIAQGFDAYNNSVTGNVSKTLDTGADYHHVPNVYSSTMSVRRLTPTECERLQGFPDNYTNIKENCPDGPRYKALGNSMAVPVMKWIGERINAKGI